MACLGSQRGGADQCRLALVTHIADAWTLCYASIPEPNYRYGNPHFDGNHDLRFRALAMR